MAAEIAVPEDEVQVIKQILSAASKLTPELGISIRQVASGNKFSNQALISEGDVGIVIEHPSEISNLSDFWFVAQQIKEVVKANSDRKDEHRYLGSI